MIGVPSSTATSAHSRPSKAGCATRQPVSRRRRAAAEMWSAWMCVSTVIDSFRPSVATADRPSCHAGSTGSISTAWPVASQPSRYVYVLDTGSNSCRKIVIAALPGRQCLQLEAAPVQDRLGVSRRLLRALEHQVAGGLERNAVAAGGHRSIERVAGVLPVDHRGHALHHV